MRNNNIFIGCCTAFCLLVGTTSCVHDYFEDQTNYEVFVPEVRDKAVSDCRVMVYDQSGQLVGERYAKAPFDDDTRIAAGQFAFRFPPGNYTTYCYTNTDGVEFSQSESLSTASFRQIGQENDHEPEAHSQPSDVHWEKTNPNLFFYRRTIDTVSMERYVGRISIRFKNFPFPVSTISHSRLCASEIGTVQPLSSETATTRDTEMDCMLSLAPLEATSQDFELEHTYFPSMESDVPMHLRFHFLTAEGVSLGDFPMELIDRSTGQPLRLGPGQRLLVEVDSYTVVSISIVGWNENIESENPSGNTGGTPDVGTVIT